MVQRRSTEPQRMAATAGGTRHRQRRPTTAANLQRGVVGLLVDAHHLIDVVDEDLAVADLAGLGGFQDARSPDRRVQNSYPHAPALEVDVSAPRYSSV
jgi:hypothetical protein